MTTPHRSASDRLQTLPTWVKVVIPLCAVLVIVLVIGLTLTGEGKDSTDGATSGPTSGRPEPIATPSDADGVSRPTRSPGQVAPAPAQTPSGLPPAPVRVALDNPADLGNGVTVKVTDIESVRGIGRGPGESSGPALRVSVLVQNDSQEALAMTSSVVTLSYGDQRTPADDLSAPGVRRFPERIKPGGEGAGSFVFQVPSDRRDQIAIDFRYTTEAPTAIFRGSAP